MDKITIFEIVVCAIIAANAVAFSVLFGKVNYLMLLHQLWLEDWLRERKNDVGIHH